MQVLRLVQIKTGMTLRFYMLRIMPVGYFTAQTLNPYVSLIHLHSSSLVGKTSLQLVAICDECMCGVQVLRLVQIKTGMTLRFYMLRIMPVGLFMALTLHFGNTVYLYLTVSFIQMLKVSIQLSHLP